MDELTSVRRRYCLTVAAVLIMCAVESVLAWFGYGYLAAAGGVIMIVLAIRLHGLLRELSVLQRRAGHGVDSSNR